MRIKAISLHQPWASLVAIGAKRFETRGWSTQHRGPLAIHAAQRWNRTLRELAASEPFASALKVLAGEKHPATNGFVHSLPLGYIVAVCEVIQCFKCEDWDGSAMWGEEPRGEWSTGRERTFGDWSRGRWAWRLENVRRIEPVPCKGRQGFFLVELPEAA